MKKIVRIGKQIINLSPIVALISTSHVPQSWAAGVLPGLNAQAACHGFQCVTSFSASLLGGASAGATNFTPTHFVLFGMALIVLGVVGKRVGRY